MGNGQALLSTPKKPETGERMDQKVLSDRSQQLAMTSFSGETNPTEIWRQMMTDSIDAFRWYRDLEEKDDQVAQCLETRKQGLLSRPRQLSAASDASEDRARLDFAKDSLAAIPNFDDVLDELLDAPGHGVAIAEIIWGQDARIEAIKARPPEWFLFNPAMQVQNGPLRLKKNIWDMDGEIVPEHKFLVYTFRARYGNRRGRPLLRRCFWPSWFKRQDLKFWLKWLEKGNGTIAVKYGQAADENEQRQALEAAEAISSATAVAFKEGFEIVPELLKAARTGSTEAYNKLCDRLDDAIAKIILGQTLSSGTSQSGGGAYALGQVHEGVRLEKIAADARDLEAVINDQLLYWLFAFNDGPDVPRPKWSIDVEEPEDLLSRSQVDERLQRMGLPITAQYARKTYSIPEPDPADEILEAKQGAAGSVGQYHLEPGPKPVFSEGTDAEKDLAKLEAGAKAKALTAYAGLVSKAIEAAQTGFEMMNAK